MFSPVTTVYMFRTGQKTTSQPEKARDDKEMITIDSSPLKKPEGEEQAKTLRTWVKSQQISFNTIISSQAVAAKETASVVLKEKAINIIENNQWREVDIGSFEGKTALSIKQEYEKYHPGETAPKDANECFNYPWPEIEGEETKSFEPLKTTFKERVLSSFRDLAATYQGQTVAVFTHCEPIREAILISKGTNNFFSTKFGKNITQLHPEISTDNPLDSVISLPTIKPEYASAIKLLITDGEIRIDDTYNVTFRG